jgi:hypothetical protein
MPEVKSGVNAKAASVQSARVKVVLPPTVLPPDMFIEIVRTCGNGRTLPFGTTESSQVKEPLPVSPLLPEIEKVCCWIAADAVAANNKEPVARMHTGNAFDTSRIKLISTPFEQTVKKPS